MTARSILFTALKNSKNIPGPKRPMLVISLRTDNTVHLFAIRASERWPAAVKVNEKYMNMTYEKQYGK